MACRENTVLQPVLGLLEQILYKDDSITYTGHFSPESLLPGKLISSGDYNSSSFFGSKLCNCIFNMIQFLGHTFENLICSHNCNVRIIFIDTQLRDYWTYEGSLTFPPCSEEVTWIIYRYPMTVSLEQLEELRRLRNHEQYQPPTVPLDDGFLVDNFRYTQAINGRTVWSSFETWSYMYHI